MAEKEKENNVFFQKNNNYYNYVRNIQWQLKTIAIKTNKIKHGI